MQTSVTHTEMVSKPGKKSYTVVELEKIGGFNSKRRGNGWRDRERSICMQSLLWKQFLQEYFSKLYYWPEEHTVFLKLDVFNLSVKIAFKMSFSNVWDALVSLVILPLLCISGGLHRGSSPWSYVSSCQMMLLTYMDVSCGEIRGVVGTSWS